MRRTREALLMNSHSQVTRHVFIRLDAGEFVDASGTVAPALLPIFRCQETGAERVFGNVRPDLTLRQLTQLFGPMGDDLVALAERARRAA